MGAWYDKITSQEVVMQPEAVGAPPGTLPLSQFNNSFPLLPSSSPSLLPLPSLPSPPPPPSLPLLSPPQEAVDIFGLSALDRLFCFMIVRELQTFLKYFQQGLMVSPAFLKQLETFSATLEDPQRLLHMSHDLHVTCT